ncbi:MAG: hypothetical protein K2Y04_12235 [Caulobacteraceae bacterium]|nr:hypothetical protein [Caulobacteraceae bacterium]
MTGLTVGAAASLSGCATAPLGDVPAVALRQCAEDSAPRLLGPRPTVESLLFLGEVPDPSLAGGEIVPGAASVRAVSPEQTDYLENFDLREMDVFMDVRPTESGNHLFGPRSPAPPGVYRLTRHPSDSPECAEYEATTEAVERLQAMQPSTGFRSTILSDPQECLSYAYLGPAPDISRYSHIVYHFTDVTADRNGYGRRVEELRDRTSAVVARAASYDFRRPPWTCAAAPVKALVHLFANGPV